MISLKRFLLPLVSLAVLVVFGLPGAASAATIPVTTTADAVADDSACSLREAVTAANTNSAGASGCVSGSGSDVISVPAGNYLLSGPASDDANVSGDLDVTESVAIEGTPDGGSGTVIDGQLTDRIFDVQSDGIISSISFTARDLTLQNGRVAGASEDGGAIRMLDGNGDVTIDCATLKGNYAGDYGGAFDFENSTNGAVSTFITDSEFIDNEAGDEGGAIYTKNAGAEAAAQVLRSTFTGNHSGGSGGAIYVGGSVGAPFGLELVNSTVSQNSSNGGGAAIGMGSPNAKVWLYFSTIADNTTTLAGGGAGVQVDDNTQTIYMQATILNDNSANGLLANCARVAPATGSFITTNSRYNLEDGDSCGFSTLAPSSDLINTDALLGALADNGGQTPTRGLQVGSPAIDLVPRSPSDFCNPVGNTTPLVNEIDQRGVARATAPNPCDAGAFEGSIAASPLPWPDTDLDGVPDVTDNCAAVSNADQANLDGDAYGDVCDVDVDNDGKPDVIDSCPKVAATAISGCPAAKRKVTLSYSRKTKKFSGRVTSPNPACTGGVTVSIYRKGDRRRFLGAVTLQSSNSRFSKRKSAKPGSYQAVVKANVVAGGADCGSAKSKRVRIRL